MSGKHFSVPELNARRREAVKLRLAGNKLAAVAEKTGLSVPTVIAAHRAYLQGGWTAVDVAPRGRATGTVRALTAEQEQQARQALLADTNLPFWTLPAFRDWLDQHFDIQLSDQSLSRYLQRWTILPALGRGARTGNDVSERPVGTELLYALHQHGEAFSTLIVQDARRKLRWCSVPRNSDLLLGWTTLFEAIANDIRKPLHVIATTDLGCPTEALHDKLSRSPHRIGVLSGSVATVAATSAATAATDTHVGGKANSTKSTTAAAPATPVNTAGRRTTSRATVSFDPQAELNMSLTHLQRLEAESIHIMREVVAEAENPVMLYSIGKDSAVMLHLAMKAFYPAPPPFPLLHVDTTWKFRDMYNFRDEIVRRYGLELLVHINPDGLAKGINPFTHGSAIHTDVMKTEGLKQALDKHGFDAAFGGARRDEEKSRAKERIFSFRTAQHRWDPKNQRPELWRLYNARKHKGESIRVFPLSNWTELDIWQYIHLENIPIVPLYFSAPRPVVRRDGTLIMVDDDRMPLKAGEKPEIRNVRFRTLGCYPLTGAVESNATTLPAIIQEMLLARTSERQGRVIDHDSAASMEKKKQEGYF